MRSLVALCVTVAFYNSYTQKIPIYIFFTFIALFYFNFSFLFILYFVERSSWLFNVQFFSSWILICFCDNDANTLHYTVWTQKNKVILQFHILLAIHFNLFHLSACILRLLFWKGTDIHIRLISSSITSSLSSNAFFFSQTLQKYSLLLPLQPLVLLV